MGAFFYKLAAFLVNRLPLKLSYWLAECLGGFYYLFALSSRRIVRNNLLHLFNGNIGRDELRFYIKRTFREFSKYLVELFFFPSLNKENIDRFISIENLHYVDELLKFGKGIIVLAAHFGNWEMGGITMGLKGYPMNALVLDHRNKSVNNFFVNRRESKGERNIPLGFAIRRCFEALRQNEILAVLGDREFNRLKKGIKINFCGRETRPCIPKGAAKLAIKTGAKIIPAFVVREKNNRLRLVFKEPLEVNYNGNEEEDVRRIMEDFFAIFEKMLKKNPAQWFIFHPLWEEID